MNRLDFPILTQQVHNRPLIYLDNAATTQKPQAVIDAIIEGYTTFNANVHRGVHHLSQIATEHHEQARQKVASFLGAEHASEIIFTKGTTDSLNMLAFSFGEAFINEGDEIIVSYLEHHSNIVPWQILAERKKALLRVIPLCEDLSLNTDALNSLINEHTRIISVAQVSNVLGIENPIQEIIRLAHNHHIPVCIDGAQSTPHKKIDLQALDCDFFVYSAHKIYGPTGLGILYGKKQWLEQLPPAEGGGEMIEHVRFEKTTYNTLPYKFEAGTPNYIGSYAFAKAIEYIQSLTLESIEEHESTLMTYMEDNLLEIPEVHVYAPHKQKFGALSFNVCTKEGKLIHPFDVGVLLDQQGIAVRTGHHCAEPLIDYLKVPGTIRASVALYNDKNDIDTFIQALKKAIMMLS